jgi:ATP-dependent RNA helicase HelY
VELPSGPTRRAFGRLVRLYSDVRRREEARALELTRPPDPAFAYKARLWASGAGLDEVLETDDAPGDFVRSTKQLLDLLRQLEDIADDGELQARIAAALESTQRGVVAYSSLDL